jgi:uncharacterized protein YjiS (DUF1127 family)
MPIRIDTIFSPTPYEGGVVATARRGLRALDRAATAVLTAVFDSRRRVAERRMLASLDDRMLKDLGLSRSDVQHEIRKRFWQE